ncbi:CAPNN [Acanthosepion pharaonis]|uniref:CAPNN n=1 Tax=Acanthosepion pharaonis TaxID=158019 RepID=A0A812CL31_ACAPH|nr:CAPNN [Sepia pharaonis]
MPPNTTSPIQPFDQGIIRSFKAYYRRELVRMQIAAIAAVRGGQADNCFEGHAHDEASTFHEFDFEGFGIEPCRSMVALHDGDMSGKLGFDEFQTLWKDLYRWKTTFKKFDIDKSGNLNSYELRSALNHSGFKLSNNAFQALVMRYSNKAGQITFADFVMCTIRLKSMLASFKSHESNNCGISGFHLDDFIQLCIYS